jgi:hypothetical protein
MPRERDLFKREKMLLQGERLVDASGRGGSVWAALSLQGGSQKKRPQRKCQDSGAEPPWTSMISTGFSDDDLPCVSLIQHDGLRIQLCPVAHRDSHSPASFSNADSITVSMHSIQDASLPTIVVPQSMKDLQTRLNRTTEVDSVRPGRRGDTLRMLPHLP